MINQTARWCNRASLTEAQFQTLIAQWPATTSLMMFMQWTQQHRSIVKSPAIVADLIQQDEFTFDAIVPLNNNLVLTLDVN